MIVIALLELIELIFGHLNDKASVFVFVELLAQVVVLDGLIEFLLHASRSQLLRGVRMHHLGGCCCLLLEGVLLLTLLMLEVRGGVGRLLTVH